MKHEMKIFLQWMLSSVKKTINTHQWNTWSSSVPAWTHWSPDIQSPEPSLCQPRRQGARSSWPGRQTGCCRQGGGKGRSADDEKWSLLYLRCNIDYISDRQYTVYYETQNQYLVMTVTAIFISSWRAKKIVLILTEFLLQCVQQHFNPVHLYVLFIWGILHSLLTGFANLMALL